MMSKRRTAQRPQSKSKATLLTTPLLAAQPVAQHVASIWIDHDRAVIVEQGPDDREGVERLDRGADENEMIFEARLIDEVLDDDRVLVSGPLDARLDFERAYVAVTHRPDRLTDVEPPKPPRPGAHRPA